MVAVVVGSCGCMRGPTDLFEYIEMHQTVRAQSKNNSAKNVIICIHVYIIIIDDIYGGIPVSHAALLLKYYTDERDFSI